MGQDYYQILGIGESASEEEIKKAYRKLSKRYHPDANPDNEEAAQKFYGISQAYEALSDPERRKAYDDSRRQKDTGGGKKTKTGTKQAGHTAPDFDIGNMGGAFESFFGFHPKSGEADGEKLDKNKKTRTNPIDMTDVFEKYMGIKK